MLIDIDLYNNLSNQLRLPSPITRIFNNELKKELLIKRDDLIHPIISGNKWRKLQKHLEEYNHSGKLLITSMGGAYSNHLHALAFVCFQLKIPCTLFVYGWEASFNSPTLDDCKMWNARLIPVSRSEAASLRLQSETQQQDRFMDSYWIPEGGGGRYGIEGIYNLVYEMPGSFDQIDNLMICACGTGTTIQGIIQSTKAVQVATVQSVKMANYLWKKNPRVHLLGNNTNIKFGKITDSIINFIHTFQNQYQVLLDPIYTAPLLSITLESGITNNYKNIYFLHTGGLQGSRTYGK